LGWSFVPFIDYNQLRH